VASVAGGCGQDSIAVGAGTSVADYNHGELLAAIDRFVAAGRSAMAFGVLASEVAALRRGMDENVAQEAERRMLVLALDPVEVVAERPLDEQVSALSTTVWPFALSAPLGDAAPTGKVAEREQALKVRAGEGPSEYLERLCGDVLAVECKFAVPEMQGALVRAVAVARLTERVRTAVQACETCGKETTWRKAVRRWEELDRVATATSDEDQQRARPERWPTAGAGAAEWPEVPLLVVEDDGDAVLDRVVLSPGERVPALTRARAGVVLGVHLPPATRADQVVAVLHDAARAGYREVVIQAREAQYPWRLRGYRVRTERARGPKKTPWRPIDTLQVVLRAIDVSGASEPARL